MSSLSFFCEITFFAQCNNLIQTIPAILRAACCASIGIFILSGAFAASRLQHAFHLQQEPTVKIWNTCTAGDMKGRDGFLKCLQHTLYRPRDLLALLNQAFYHAGKNGQSQIVGDNVEAAARMISRTRMDDLQKEYEAILPGLRSYIAAFHGREPDLTVDVALRLLAGTMDAGFR